MKSLLITAAATTAALIVVLSTRLVIPALILVYRYIEQGFAPEEPVIAGVLPMSAAPLAVVSEPIEQRQDKPAPRKARRRKPSAKTLARAEAALA
jgi:hypothetical protein